MYTSVSGDIIKILLDLVFFTWYHSLVSVSSAAHVNVGSGCG